MIFSPSSGGFVTPVLRLLHAPPSVASLVGKPLWSCGSCPLVVAALAERPGLLLTLLQHGAGVTESSRPDKCYKLVSENKRVQIYFSIYFKQ